MVWTHTIENMPGAIDNGHTGAKIGGPKRVHVDRGGNICSDDIYHGSLFRFSRNIEELSIDEEMRLSGYVTAQMGELALSVVRDLSSTLTILYFS